MTSFKVGDKVRIKSSGRHQGKIGHITLLAGNHAELKTTEGLKHIWATVDELELNVDKPVEKVDKLNAAQKSCEHKWVMYQPFRGEAYECCANGPCGITKADYQDSLPHSNEQPLWTWGSRMSLTDDQLCFDLDDYEDGTGD